MREALRILLLAAATLIPSTGTAMEQVELSLLYCFPREVSDFTPGLGAQATALFAKAGPLLFGTRAGFYTNSARFQEKYHYRFKALSVPVHALVEVSSPRRQPLALYAEAGLGLTFQRTRLDRIDPPFSAIETESRFSYVLAAGVALRMSAPFPLRLRGGIELHHRWLGDPLFGSNFDELGTADFLLVKAGFSFQGP